MSVISISVSSEEDVGAEPVVVALATVADDDGGVLAGTDPAGELLSWGPDPVPGVGAADEDVTGTLSFSDKAIVADRIAMWFNDEHL